MADKPKYVLTPEETWPQCPKCKCNVPSFAYLDSELRTEVELARGGTSNKARLHGHFRNAGIPLKETKVFILHLHGIPEPPFGQPIPNCPYCGKPLRTARAKQCRWCKKDWHEQ